MKLITTLAAAALALSGCGFAGADNTSVDEFDSWGDYWEVSDDLSSEFSDAAANPANWKFSCVMIASTAADGLALPETPSDELNREWDAAMSALTTADDGDLTGCIAALDVAQPHIENATAVIAEMNQ